MRIMPDQFITIVKCLVLNDSRNVSGLHQESQDDAVDDFVKKIREFSASVSGSKSPMAIIMFGVSIFLFSNTSVYFLK